MENVEPSSPRSCCLSQTGQTSSKAGNDSNGCTSSTEFDLDSTSSIGLKSRSTSSLGARRKSSASSRVSGKLKCRRPRRPKRAHKAIRTRAAISLGISRKVKVQESATQDKISREDRCDQATRGSQDGDQLDRVIDDQDVARRKRELMDSETRRRSEAEAKYLATHDPRVFDFLFAPFLPNDKGAANEDEPWLWSREYEGWYIDDPATNSKYWASNF